MNSGANWARVGRFCLNTSNRISASTPAMVARATVKNIGSNCSTATRVAGSEPLKISTPRNPLSQPPAVFACPFPCFMYSPD